MGSHWDSSSLDDLKKITGVSKPVIFLTSNYKNAETYTGHVLTTDKNTIFCCKVYTKNLYFSYGRQIINEYIDEYLYTEKIPSKDLILITDPRIHDIVKKFPYLVV